MIIFSRLNMLLFHFNSFLELFLRSIAKCGLSPFAVTQMHCSVVHNKVLFCATLSLLTILSDSEMLQGAETDIRQWNEYGMIKHDSQ